MYQLQSQYRDLVEVINIGQSVEDQPLQLIKISTGGSEDKLGVFIDGGNMFFFKYVHM